MRLLLLFLLGLQLASAVADGTEQHETISSAGNKKPERIPRIAAGLLAGALSSIALQPLEVVKTRMQTSTFKGRMNIVSITRKVWREEGAARLWAGTLPSMIRLAGGIALYFVFLGEVEAIAKRTFRSSGSPHGSSSVIGDFLIGGVSRALAAGFFCPITVLKTRAEGGVATPGGLMTQLATLSRTEGVNGLFAGLGATLLRDVPYSGISLALLRRFRKLLLESTIAIPLTLVGAFAGAASSLCATLLTQPADVLQTELVLQGLKGRRLGLMHVMANLVRTRSVGSLFAGVSARLLRRMLQQGFAWAVFEAIVGS